MIRVAPVRRSVVDAKQGGRFWLILIPGLTLAVMLASALVSPAGCGGGGRVVLYCAQDQEFAEKSLADFKARTGLEVAPKYDTEKDKSVSLFRELVAEKDRPRCDVFWNNEVINTIRLQRDGLLEAYDSPSAKPYPSWAKASDHTWYAFAARARILIVNTDLVKPEDRPKGLLDLTDKRWKGRVVMAKPVHGTSATQGACLFAVLGPDRAKWYYRGLKDNGVRIAPGNKQVAELVGQGTLAVGITDTDDALEEIEAGHHVAMLFPDRDRDRPKDDPMGTLFIPNSLCIPKNCPDPAGARKLVDFLLSAEVEGELAKSASHQIPLNPEVKAELPGQMETPATVKAMDVSWEKAADLWDQSQEFLRQQFETAE
jgi:iron(III) transport system substrate-binding protein